MAAEQQLPFEALDAAQLQDRRARRDLDIQEISACIHVVIYERMI